MIGGHLERGARYQYPTGCGTRSGYSPTIDPTVFAPPHHRLTSST